MTVPRRIRAILAYFALYSAIGAVTPYLALYYQSLGLDLVAIGSLVSMTAGVGLLAAPGWGAASDRFGGSPLVLAGATVVATTGALVLWLAAAAPGEVAGVIGGAILLSLGLAGIGPIVDARALESAGIDRSGYGPLRAWGSIAFIASSALTGLAVDRLGLPVLFGIFGVSMVLTAVVGLTLAPAEATAADRPLRTAAALFRRRSLGLFLAGSLAAWVGLSAVSAFYPLRFGELGAPASVVGVAAALAAAVEVPIMLRFPSLVARFGSHRLLVAGAAIFVLRAGGAALTDLPTVLVVLSGIGGAGFALFLVGGVTYVSGHVPRELAATAQGIFQGIAFGLAQVVASGLGGGIANAFGLPGLFFLSTVVGVVATVLVAFAVRPRSLAASV